MYKLCLQFNEVNHLKAFQMFLYILYHLLKCHYYNFNLINLILAAVNSRGVHDGVVEGGGVHVQGVDQLASLGRGSQVLSGSLHIKSYIILPVLFDIDVGGVEGSEWSCLNSEPTGGSRLVLSTLRRPAFVYLFLFVHLSVHLSFLLSMYLSLH